jgi:hypothetical protein
LGSSYTGSKNMQPHRSAPYSGLTAEYDGIWFDSGVSTGSRADGVPAEMLNARPVSPQRHTARAERSRPRFTGDNTDGTLNGSSVSPSYGNNGGNGSYGITRTSITTDRQFLTHMMSTLHEQLCERMRGNSDAINSDAISFTPLGVNDPAIIAYDRAEETELYPDPEPEDTDEHLFPGCYISIYLGEPYVRTTAEDHMFYYMYCAFFRGAQPAPILQGYSDGNGGSS